MSVADSVKAGVEQVREAQAKVIEGYGGNPPRELTEQFQKIQDKMAGNMEWVQKLSDQAEEAKAKALALTQSEVNGTEGKKEEGIDFEAYPWQFEKEHGLGLEPSRELVQSLLGDNEEPRASNKRPTHSKARAASYNLSEPFFSPTDIASEWDAVASPD